MILTVLGILSLVVGIILLSVRLWENYFEVKQAAGLFLTMLGVVVIVICICICLQTKPPHVYEDMQAERRMLEYELDRLNDMTDSDASYEHIIKFNNKLMLIKKRSSKSLD